MASVTITSPTFLQLIGPPNCRFVVTGKVFATFAAAVAKVKKAKADEGEEEEPGGDPLIVIVMGGQEMARTTVDPVTGNWSVAVDMPEGLFQAVVAYYFIGGAWKPLKMSPIPDAVSVTFCHVVGCAAAAKKPAPKVEPKKE